MFQPQFEREETVKTGKRNRMNLRNSFFLFATGLKSATLASYPMAIFTLIADLCISVFVEILPIIPYLGTSVTSVRGEPTVFPNSEYLQILTPGVLPTSVWITLSIILMLFAIVCFIICLRGPSMIVHLWWAICPQVHLIILPFVTISFGFSVFGLLRLNDMSSGDYLGIVLVVCLFPFYAVLTCLLFFVETNSLLRPNPIFSEWLYGFGFFYPLWVVIESFLCSVCHHVSQYNAITLLAVGGVLQLSCAGWLFYKMPFILPLTNQLMAAKTLAMFCVNALSIAVILSNASIGTWMIVIIPLLLIMCFLISYTISEKRRNNMHQFLKQFDSSVSEFTVDVIRMTLAATIRSENEFQWVIRESFVSGNVDILSQRFVQSCLQIYPSSQWLLSMVTLLFALVWGANSSVYRVLLHLMSVNKLNPVASLILFQCIYAYQQSSKDVSPMIMREVSKCRKLVSQYVERHRVFWASAANADLKRFRESISGVCDCVRQLKSNLHQLEVKFPFCPVVHLELSLYYADIRHNYVKSSKHFRIYESLVEDKGGISNALYTQFTDLFPITTTRFHGTDPKKERKKAAKSELVFLSFHDKHEHASRCVIPPLKDSYFSLCQTYSLSQRQARMAINFDRARLFAFKVMFVASIIVISAFTIVNIVILTLYVEKTLKYNNIIYNINGTLAFRRYVSACYMDTLLIQNFQMNAFSIQLDDQTNSSFREFLIAHFSRAYDRMLEYKYMVDDMNNSDISYDLPECQSLNCTFSYLFGSLHTVSNFYVMGNSDLDLSYTPEELEKSVGDLLNLSDHIYARLSQARIEMATSMRKAAKLSMYIMIPLEPITFLVFLFLFKYMAKRLHQDLFLVISTVPSSILNDVASIFDKITRFTGYNVRMPPSHIEAKGWIAAACACVMNIIFPIYLATSLLEEFPASMSVDRPPVLISMNETTQFVAFSTAYAEFSMNVEKNVSVTVEMAEDFGSGCVHGLTQVENGDLHLPVAILEKDISLTIAAAAITAILAFIFIVVFIVHEVSLLATFQMMQYFLKYIPETARNSNPVLQMLTKGTKVPMSQVEDFRKDALDFVFTDEKFGCILYFDKLGNLVHSRGNPSQFLPYIPSDINDVQQQLINNNCGTVAQIRAFFDEAKRDQATPKSISFKPYSEITLAFSHKGSVLLLANNSRHYIVNQQIRTMQNIHYRSATQSETIECGAVIIFKVQESTARQRLKALATDEFEIRDMRYKKFVFVKKLEDLRADVRAVLNFIINAQQFLKNDVGACAFGGPLFIFGKSAGFPVIRNRVYGLPYELSREMLCQVECGKIMVQKELFDLADLVISHHVSEVRSVPVVIIDSNCL